MIAQLVGKVALHRVVEVAVKRGRGHALIQKFSHVVRLEALRDIVRRIRHLVGESGRWCAVERHDSEIIAEIQVRIDIGRGLDSRAGKLEFRQEAGLIGQLVNARRERGNHAYPGGRIQIVGKKPEALTLIRPVVNRIRRRRRGTERAVALAIQSAHVVAEFALAAAVLKAWLDRIALTAVDAQAAAGLFAAVLGLDIQHPAGGEAVARRQHTIEQAHLFDEHRIDHRDERRIGIDIDRHHDAVDLILELRPLGVADVDLLVLIDSDAGHLRQHVGDSGIVAARQVGNILRGHGVLVGAGGGYAILCANQVGIERERKRRLASRVIATFCPALPGNETIFVAGLNPGFHCYQRKDSRRRVNQLESPALITPRRADHGVVLVAQFDLRPGQRAAERVGNDPGNLLSRGHAGSNQAKDHQAGDRDHRVELSTRRDRSRRRADSHGGRSEGDFEALIARYSPPTPAVAEDLPGIKRSVWHCGRSSLKMRLTLNIDHDTICQCLTSRRRLACAIYRM